MPVSFIPGRLDQGLRFSEAKRLSSLSFLVPWCHMLLWSHLPLAATAGKGEIPGPIAPHPSSSCGASEPGSIPA